MSKEIIEMLGAIQEKQDTNVAQIEAKQTEAITGLESKLDETQEELKTRIKAVEVQASAISTATSQPAQMKSLGQLVVSEKRFEEFKSGNMEKATIEIKAPTGEVANADAQTYSQRLAGIVGLPQAAPSVYSVLPRGRATSNAIDYIKEVEFISNADEVAENNALPLSEVEFEEVQTPVVTVGHHIKMSDQMMADNTAAADLIDSRMGSKALQKLDSLIVNGAGAMKGLIDVTNHTALAGTEGDGIYQSIRRGITALEVGEFTAGLIILNPADVEMLDLDSLADGEFRASNPRAYNTPTAWGLPVVKSHHVTAGKFFVLDTSYVTVWERAGVVVEVGHDTDDFTSNRKTVRANVRAALTVYNAGGVIYGDVATDAAAATAKAKQATK